MGNIKLMMLLHETLNEIGDLQNITPYEYKKINNLNYIFSANINGEKTNVKVWFDNIENAIPLLKVNSQIYNNNLKKYYQDGVYNMGFSVNKKTSQYDKTNLREYFPILKTISNIAFEFINNRDPFAITVFGEDKKGTGGIDPQKTLLYFKLLSSNLPKKYRLDNIEYLSKKNGYVIYKN
jgi:hypothetical protein